MSLPLRALGLTSLIAAAITLVACGGGSNAPATSTAVTVTTTPRPAATATPVATAPEASAPAASAPAVSQAAMDEANKLFDTRCAACHGASGKGDGPAGVALPTHPADYTSAAFQASVTDAEIEKAIVQGGAAVGKSPLMVPNPDLASKPEVVAALRMKVRSFGQK